MDSCIYEGIVTHRRFVPIDHNFQYRLFMLYLDLEELPDIVGRDGLISGRRCSTASFLAEDHLSSKPDIAQQVRQLILDQSGEASTGKIRLLTQLRYFGYYFSPLNLFYVNDNDDREVGYVLAEVNNTPWGQRHIYLLWQGNQVSDTPKRFVHRKQMHVSPFMDMEMDYHWYIASPGEKLSVVLENHRSDQRIFSAGLKLQRRELTRSSLIRMSCRYPWMTAQIIAAIHYQALKLWWKKCPVHIHPEKQLTRSAKPARNRVG